MTEQPQSHGIQNGAYLRASAWIGAIGLLLLPWIAMQFTDEVNWSGGDFAVFALLLLGVLIPFELLLRQSGNRHYRLAAGIGLVGAFLLAWISLGVGIIGRDGDPANLLYGAVLAAGFVGGLIGRGRAPGMARAMAAAACVVAVIWLVAVVMELGQPYSGPLELSVLNGFFVVLFSVSAWLFHKAASGSAKTHES